MTAKWQLPDGSEFMGKTFQAAQLTHERFLTIDHSYKIFFWYLPNWTSTNLWCVVPYVTYSTTHQRSVEVQFSRYQKYILQEWSMVKNLSCVSCAAWNVFPINSLVGGVCCVYFRWLLVMAHVYCMIIKKWSIFMGGIFDNIIAAMFIHMYLHQWSVVSKKVSSFFDVVIFDRYAKVWQHDCDQHVNFCYLNYLLTQVHNRNFFLYNLSFGFEDDVTKVSLLIFIEVHIKFWTWVNSLWFIFFWKSREYLS